MPIKSFKGLLANGGQETINLHTNNGSIGYRIKKFQVISQAPGDAAVDLVMKVYKIEQTTVPSTGATIDLSDNTLLAVAHYSAATATFSQDTTIIFDNEVFNQDIYVTLTDNDGNDSCNYYIELEQVRLSLDENTVATLKDIRNIKSNS